MATLCRSLGQLHLLLAAPDAIPILKLKLHPCGVVTLGFCGALFTSIPKPENITHRRKIVMPTYVDGYVLPVPKDRIEDYRRLAEKAATVWKEHGALEYRECAGEDLDVNDLVPFPRMVELQPGETVVFAWIVFNSRQHRDEVNAKVMKDPRLAETMDQKNMPFDMKRMVYGGFEVIVEA